MVTHLLRTHLFMEPIAVASYRQLPTIHPVWKLLAPHIRGVLAINTLGRDVLIAEGGVADNTLTVGGGGKTITHSVNLSPGRSNYQVSGLNCSLTHIKNKDIYHIFFRSPDKSSCRAPLWILKIFLSTLPCYFELDWVIALYTCV